MTTTLPSFVELMSSLGLDRKDSGYWIRKITVTVPEYYKRIRVRRSLPSVQWEQWTIACAEMRILVTWVYANGGCETGCHCQRDLQGKPSVHKECQTTPRCRSDKISGDFQQRYMEPTGAIDTASISGTDGGPVLYCHQSLVETSRN